MVIRLGGIIESPRVVDGDDAAPSRIVLTVTGDEGLFCDAHFLFDNPMN